MIFPITYLFIPFISAFIGWMTNYIAVKLLFRPYQEKRLFFLKIQGIFPKRRGVLTERLSTIIAEDFLHKEKLIEQITDNSRIDDLIAEYVKDFMKNIINTKIKNIPLISSFLGENTIKSIEVSLLSEFKKDIRPTKNKFIHEAIDAIDVKKSVQEYLNTLSMSEMEKLVRSVLKKEFYFIEWSGAVLGFFIGLGQLGIIAWR